MEAGGKAPKLGPSGEEDAMIQSIIDAPVQYTGPQPYEFTSAERIPGYTPPSNALPEEGYGNGTPVDYGRGDTVQGASLNDKSPPPQTTDASKQPEQGLYTPQLEDPEMQRALQRQGRIIPSQAPLAQLRQILGLTA